VFHDKRLTSFKPDPRGMLRSVAGVK